MTGEVSRIDQQKGTVTLKTDTGTFEFRVPPAFLQNVKQGSTIFVELGLSDDSAAASPGMDGPAGQEGLGTKK